MKRQNSPVFWRTLKLNFIIVAVITVSLACLSAAMRTTMRENEEANCHTTLEYGMAQLTAQIRAASDNVIAFRESVTQKSAYGLMRYDAVNLLKAKRELATIVSNNVLVGEIAYVYEDRDMVITTNSIYYSIDDFLSLYSIEGMDTDRFYSYIDEENRLATIRFFPCESIKSPDRARINTAFCCAIPLDTERYTTLKGVVYVFLKVDGLLDITVSDRIRPYASLFLYDNRRDREGTQLFAYESAYSASDHFETTLINSTGTLRAEVRIAGEYLDGQMKEINQYIIGILLAAVLAGIGSALWSTYRQYLPMRQVIRQLQERGLLVSQDQNEYSGFMDSVENLLSEKESVTRQLSGYQHSLQRNLMDRLFSNTVLRHDVEETLRMELDFFPERSLVYCGRIFISSADTNESMELMLMMVLEYLRKNMPSSAILHSTDTMTFGLIYPCEQDAEAAEELLGQVVAGVSQRFAARVVLTLGGHCEGMGQIGACFERAQVSSLNESGKGRPDQLIVHPQDNAESPDQCLRLLQSMHQFMAGGDAEGAVDAMEEFFACPTEHMLIDVRERYRLLRAYIMMVAREVVPQQPCPHIPSLCGASDPAAQRQILADAIRGVCQSVSNRQAGAQDDQCATYIAYLKAHYQDSELCASALANEFRVSEKYLFGLFKKKTGYSPTSYLHHIRMEEAERLLKECDDTVQGISARVGFANFGTFHKAFKREYGMAPGRYRELNQTQGG